MAVFSVNAWIPSWTSEQQSTLQNIWYREWLSESVRQSVIQYVTQWVRLSVWLSVSQLFSHRKSQRVSLAINPDNLSARQSACLVMLTFFVALMLVLFSTTTDIYMYTGGVDKFPLSSVNGAYCCLASSSWTHSLIYFAHLRNSCFNNKLPSSLRGKLLGIN
jgi:hypothetical protein